MWIRYDLGYYRKERRRLIADARMWRQGYMSSGMGRSIRSQMAYARECFYHGRKVAA